LATKYNILITAGPTWVPIDKVRVISNRGSGKTGSMLAEKLIKKGAKVTLLLGPGENMAPDKPGIKIIRFRYFSELDTALKNELKKQKYSAIVHSASVSDYAPAGKILHKVSSRLSSWKINLIPTKKLIGGLRTLSAHSFIVGFKFEPDLSARPLVEKGRELLKRCRLNLVVANSDKGNKYRAYILGDNVKNGPFADKHKMTDRLSAMLIDALRKTE
jgi:phosphopantothenoylcysteine decarboxylase/phosphopantothenate--cysteine ligase